MSSANLGTRPVETPDSRDKELNELRHNVKILTIENNTLSDYIEKLKKTLGTKIIEPADLDRNRKERIDESVQKQAHY
jgi:regulator of replication initiation timing